MLKNRLQRGENGDYFNKLEFEEKGNPFMNILQTLFMEHRLVSF